MQLPDQLLLKDKGFIHPAFKQNSKKICTIEYTVTMNDHEKIIVRQRLGIALQNILARNKQHPGTGKVTSLHQLADAAAIQYYTVQNISSGKKDPQFTTLVSIAAGLNIPLSELIAEFESANRERE